MNSTGYEIYETLIETWASWLKWGVCRVSTGWPPNQGIQGKIREFTCCLKEVKNSQGKRHKNAGKSGKKHWLEKKIKKSGNLHVMTFTSIWFKVPYIHLRRVKFSPAAALQKNSADKVREKGCVAKNPVMLKSLKKDVWSGKSQGIYLSKLANIWSKNGPKK